MKGKKYDRGKATITMIPRSAIEQEAQVLAYGASKYGRDNWRLGMEWTRLLDASMRHILAFNEGEDLDPETGISHLAHARCSLGFLIEYIEKGLGNDNRFKKEDKPFRLLEMDNMSEAVRSTLQSEAKTSKD